MVLRKLAMALLSIGVVLPGLTHALALREVKTKSALGEPFHAEIELAELGDLTEEDIKVNLAQAEDFARLGIEEVYILAELRFTVVVKQDGRSYIKISTHKRVTEPFLDFIIRVSLPNNTRLQQVTALLDPPMTKVTKAKEPVLAPIVVVQAQPVIEPVAPPVMVEPEVNTPAPVNSYRVRKNDTLWKVARRVRPSPDISVSQMMKVLHKANPQAFIGNNINWLKDGEVLRVPSLMDNQSLAELKQHSQNTPAVVQAQAANKPLARQQIDATAPKSVSVAPSAPRAQMKLVAPKANQHTAASSTGLAEAKPKTKTSVPSSTANNGSSVISGAKSVQKVAQNNQLLSQELSSLETQLKLNDKKIAMQNAKLAQLEAQLKARRLAAEQAKHSEKKTDLDKKAVATLACAIAMQSFFTTEAKAEEAATTASTAPAAPAEGGSSMMPIIGGGLVLLIVAVIFFLKSKGKKDQPAPPAVKPQAPAVKPVAPVAKAEAPVAAPAPVAKPTPVEPPKPQDPLEEVRPYLEMERYPQAVGLLTKALVQHPDRADIHLKLLEIFAKQKDHAAFDAQYGKLEMLGELEAIVAADKLKQQLPELPKKVEKSKLNEEGHLEFESSKLAPVVPVVEESPAFSLDDLENDFKMSLSNPNMKALDIPLASDPIELQRPEEPVVEQQKIAELDSLLDKGLEFKFDQKAPVAPAEEHQGLDFKFETPEPEPAKTDLGTGLSLDSLDDFLAEHKIEEQAKPTVEPTPAASLDFEQELAKFKEEKHEVEVEQNLTEGFELEEFKFDDSSAKENDLGFDVADVDFSIEEQPLIEEKSEFKLDFDTPSADLSDMVASFDKEELADVELPDDLNFDDVDVSVSSDDVLAELDKEFSFLASTNENSTRLELARAYMEMGDRLGARDLLEEVVAEGDSNQKTEAQGMLMRIA